MNKKALGKLLRQKRKELKLSLEEMAGASQGILSPSYLSALELGKVSKTRYDKLLMAAEMYQVNFEIVKSAFMTSAKEAEEIEHVDIILKQIASDEKLKLHDLFQQVLDEEGELSKNLKILLIRFYETIYRKKLL